MPMNQLDVLNHVNPETVSDDEKIMLALQTLAMSCADGIDNSKAYLSLAAVYCLGKMSPRMIDANTVDDFQPVHDMWHADATWFGPGFAEAIRIRDGVVYTDMRAQHMALAHFSQKLVNGFVTLIPALAYYLDDDEGKFNCDALIGRLQLFSQKVVDINPELACQPGMPRQLLMEVDNMRDLGLQAPQPTNWKAYLDAGYVVMGTGAAFLHIVGRGYKG
jgi:hypothetical protein